MSVEANEFVVCDQLGHEVSKSQSNLSCQSWFDIESDQVCDVINSKPCRCSSTVLLADDNPFNLMPLQCILMENYGIICDLVENGMEEVNAFIADYEKTCCPLRYKLILTDLNMPEMDGFDAAKSIYKYLEIKNIPLSNYVPIVAVTAYDDTGTL